MPLKSIRGSKCVWLQISLHITPWRRASQYENMQFFQISPNPGNIKQPTLDGVQQVTLSTETDAGWKIIQHHCMNKAVVLKRRKETTERGRHQLDYSGGWSGTGGGNQDQRETASNTENPNHHNQHCGRPTKPLRVLFRQVLPLWRHLGNTHEQLGQANKNQNHIWMSVEWDTWTACLESPVRSDTQHFKCERKSRARERQEVKKQTSWRGVRQSEQAQAWLVTQQPSVVGRQPIVTSLSA